MSTNKGQPLRRRGDPKPPPVRKPSTKRRRCGRAAWDEVCQGADLTPEEIEFGRAMERWMRNHDCPYPDWRDVLAVAKSLGYKLS